MEERNTNYYTNDGLIMQGEQIDIGVAEKVALDHGWSSIKGEHIFIETLVSPVDYTPLTNNGLLEYRGKKYIIGQGRLGKQATKTENDNYFLLTLVGIAKELRYQGREKITHVELYAGVPLTMVNQLFAGSLAMMGQVQKPLQVEQSQQSFSHLSVSEARCCTMEENLGTEVRDLETDNHNSMDMDTRSALGSLFDDED